MVFAKMLYDDKNIEEVEYQIYNKWFDEFIEDIPPIKIIYVKTSPEVANQRVQKRGRVGEIIPLDYLKNCHKYHEDWLNSTTTKLTIEADVDVELNPEIKTQWLEECEEFINNKFIMNNQHYTLMFDGGSRGNPGLCGSGYVILNNETVEYEGYQKVSDKNTNNFAEYMGIILGMELALEKDINILHIKGDSLLVINQLTGKWKVKSNSINALYTKAKTLLDQFKMVTLSHVKRENNKLADALANKAMDM